MLQGSNERDAAGGPQVVIRDLMLGAELGRMSKDRSDYVEMRSKAQAACAEADLVTAVSDVLARHTAA